MTILVGADMGGRRGGTVFPAILSPWALPVPEAVETGLGQVGDSNQEHVKRWSKPCLPWGKH